MNEEELADTYASKFCDELDTVTLDAKIPAAGAARIYRMIASEFRSRAEGLDDEVKNIDEDDVEDLS